MVAIKKDESDTAESIGKNLSAKFTDFVKKSPKVCIVKIFSFCSLCFIWLTDAVMNYYHVTVQQGPSFCLS